MSNIPTPTNAPPTPQQVDRTLHSVVNAAQQLIAKDARHFANLRASFLAFYTHPTFQLILGIPSQVPPTASPPNNQQQSELTEIKSAIKALTKSVVDLQPKVNEAKAPSVKNPPPTGNASAQGKGPASLTQTPTYASKAASKSRPSLVLDIGAANPEDRFTPHLNDTLNGYLHEIGHDEVKLSATRYNKKGNLVITAHHSTTQTQLNNVANIIKSHIEHLSDTNGIPLPHPITARANVKWSKILINSVPVGATKQRAPFSPDECHRSLVAHNPSYASLQITQKPSWVRPPSTLKPDTYSSLVVAFEDPNGSARRSLLSSKQLYILGARAKVSRWKENKRPSSKNNEPTPNSPTSSNFSLSLEDHNPLDLVPLAQMLAPLRPPSNTAPPVTHQQTKSARNTDGPKS